MGIEGAAIATLIGYAISNIVVIIVLKRMKLMIVSKRMLISAIMTFIYIALWRVLLKDNIVINLLVVIAIVITYIALYKNEILTLFNNIRRKKEK